MTNRVQDIALAIILMLISSIWTWLVINSIPPGFGEGEIGARAFPLTFGVMLFCLSTMLLFRKIKFIDEVNDFPALYLSAGTENRDFNTKSLTVATLDVTIRAYVFGEDDAQTKVDDLIQDIEHVIYNFGDNSDKGIFDIQIDNITADEGLIEPYGLAEIVLTIQYRLED